MKKAVSVMAGFFALTISLFSQINVSGIVYDEGHNVVPGAHVILHGTYKAAISDAEGEFNIREVKKGNYLLEVRHLSYKLFKEAINLKRDTTLQIGLEKRVLVGDEIVVLGTRAGWKDPVSHTTLSRNDLDESGSVQDIPYLLSMTPSVVQSSDAGNGVGYTALRIRGTDPSRINVTINGIPYNDSESHDVYWVDIPDVVSSAESIQIQRGVGTSTNGAGVFGANINILTNQLNPEPYARVQGAMGSYNTYKASVQAGTGLVNDHFSFDIRLSDIHSDGYIDRAFSNLSSWYVSAGWYLKKSLVKATVFSGKEVSYQAWGGVPGDSLLTNRRYNPYTYDNEVDNYLQTHYQLHWSYELNSVFNFSTALHYTKGAGYYEQYREDDDLESYLLNPVIIGNDTIYQSDLIRRKWLDNDFMGGVYSLNYSNNRLDITLGGGSNIYKGAHFGNVIWARYASNGSINHEWYRSNGVKGDHSVYLRTNYSLTDHFFLYGDLQYRRINYLIDGNDDDLRDISQEHHYNFFSPKVGWKWTITGEQQVFGSVSFANREPKRSNYTDAAPGQNIVPEHLLDVETGVQKAFNSLLLTSNAYLMYYQNQLVYTGEINDVGAAIMMNVPKSYRIGVEMALAWNITSTLKWTINSTLSQNKILNFIEYVDDWDTWTQRRAELGTTDLALSPAVIVNHTLSWEPLKSVKLKWESKYVSKQFIDNTSSDARSIDPYWINNLTAKWSTSLSGAGEFTVFFKCLNALNELYESNAWVYSYYLSGERHVMNGYYPQAGRHFLFGLLFDF